MHSPDVPAGEVIIACQLSPETTIHLVRFDDGSWGITRKGAITGTWSPEQLDQCFDDFALQVGLGDRNVQQTVYLRVRRFPNGSLN